MTDKSDPLEKIGPGPYGRYDGITPYTTKTDQTKAKRLDQAMESIIDLALPNMHCEFNIKDLAEVLVEIDDFVLVFKILLGAKKIAKHRVPHDR